MSKKRILLTALILILTMSIVVGCGLGSKKAANELLQDALIKTTEVKSSSFDGTIKLNLDLSNEVTSILDESELMVLDLLKSAQISYRGSQQLDPFQVEVILTAKLAYQGMQMQIDMPILMNTEKLWLKFPSLPIPGFDEYSGKFIEFDFQKLAQLSGEEFPNMSESMQASTQFSNEALPIFFKHFDETYFSKVDVKTLTLANDSSAKDAVEFKITQNQLKTGITTLVEKVMPEMLDLMGKTEYQKMFGLTPEMINEAKSELTVSSDELDALMSEMSEILNNFAISGVFAIDKNGFIVQQKYSVSGTITSVDEPGSVKFSLDIVQNTTKINETAKFENSYPPSPVIPFEELMMLGIGAYDDYFDYDDFYAGEYSDDYDYYEENEELYLLYEELFVQPWFIANEDIINELYDSNFEFALDMEDTDVIRALIDDEGYRTQFFAYYGVVLD